MAALPSSSANSDRGSIPVKSGAPKQRKTWSSLFTLPDMSLQFISSTDTSCKIMKAPKEVYEDLSKEWQNCVVVQFLGKIPNFGQIQKTLSMIWGRDGQVRITVVESNLYVVQLPTENTRRWVLESGPWHIMNRPVVVRNWEPGITLLDLDLSKFPIWVNLKGVPIELYTRKGLSFIASGLGKPLYMDKATAIKQKLDSAKICVEIDVEKELPEFLEVELPNEKIVRIDVDIPWKPLRCLKCKSFGHGDCTKTVKKWMPKQAIEAVEEVVAVVAQSPSGIVESLVAVRPESPLNLHSELNFPSLSGSKVSTEDRGKAVVVAKTKSSEQLERFEILTHVPIDNISVSSVRDSAVSTSHGAPLSYARNTRVASAGVAELMKQLKPKKRKPATKSAKG